MTIHSDDKKTSKHIKMKLRTDHLHYFAVVRCLAQNKLSFAAIACSARQKKYESVSQSRDYQSFLMAR